jgi:hypothetical protein
LPALAAEVSLDHSPPRCHQSESSYFVTANVLERKSLFQVEKIARLLPAEYPYSSAHPSFSLDPVPQRLKPVSLTALSQA